MKPFKRVADTHEHIRIHGLVQRQATVPTGITPNIETILE